MGMANDDDYDFSGVSQPGPLDIESSVLSQWRAQNSEEDEDDDYSYFWPEQLPYDIDEKLREINKVHQEDETPIESDRPRRITFNTRVQMRAISMRRIPPPTESNDDDESFDLSKYDTDESVEDVETSITTPLEAAKVASPVPQSLARPLPVPAASSSRGSAGPQKQRLINKATVSRVGQSVSRSPGGVSTGGFTAKGGGTGAARRGFSECQNFQLPSDPSADGLSVLSVTDEEEDDDDCVVGPVSSDTGYSSGGGVKTGDTLPAETGRPPATPAGGTAATNGLSRSPEAKRAVTAEPMSLSASQRASPAVVATASQTVSVSLETSKPSSVLMTAESNLVPPVPSTPKSTTVTVSSSKSALSSESAPSVSPAKSVPLSVSSARSVAPSVSVPSCVTPSVSASNPTTSLVSLPKPASVSVPVSVSACAPVSAPGLLLSSNSMPEPKPLAASNSELKLEAKSKTKSEPEPESKSASVSTQGPVPRLVSRSEPQSTAPASVFSAGPVQTEAQNGARLTDKPPQEAVGSSRPEMAPPTERYRPSRAEIPPRSAERGGSRADETVQNHTSVQQTSSDRNNIDSVETNGHGDSKVVKSCASQSEPVRLCRCMGDSVVQNDSDSSHAKEQLGGTKSEDSAVESLEDPSSSTTAECSAAGGVPERRPSSQSYAAIHLSPSGRPVRSPARKHEPATTGSPSAGAARPARSPTRPPSSGRRTVSPVRQREAAAAAAARPHSAPIRSAVSAPTLPRRQPSVQRVSQQAAGQSAGASPPPRRRRARSQDPSLTFQQWLQQHEKERAQAIQDRKNNAKKRKQEDNIKREKAPQAFRVWLRKKRQQQLMEQRVQQLRQHELLSAAAVPPPSRHPQPDAFRQWLTRKQRERTAAGRGPAQATLRSLSALYRVGRARPAGGGDRHDRNAHLRLIYGPHVSGGARCRSAFTPLG